MATTFTDGDWQTAERDGPPIVTYPLQNMGDTRARMVKQRFTQDARYYPRDGPRLGAGFPYDDVIPNHNSLRQVFHEDPIYLGATMIEFTAVWCDVPKDRVDTQTITFNYQFPYEDEDGIASLAEIAVGVSALVQVRYRHTANPAQIKIKQPFRYVRANRGIYNLGSRSTDGNDNILAEATQVNRWYGNIREIREMYVPPRTLGTQATYINIL